MEMKIKNFKLEDGTQLIARLGNVDSTFIYLESPMIVNVTVNNENKPQVGLFPFIIETGADNKVQLRADFIIAESEVSIDLEKYYIQATSGIDLTTKLAK